MYSLESNFMIVFKRHILLICLGSTYVIYSDKTTGRLSQTNIHGIKISTPESIHMAPDGAFDVPSVTVISGDGVIQLDVSDPMKPTIANNIATAYSFISHVWINKDEFLGRKFTGSLFHFEKQNKSEAKKWNGKKIASGRFKDLVLIQNAPKSFVIVCSRSETQIAIMWSEDADGKPGDWRNKNHIKQSYIECKSYFLTTADVNNDGKTDLLVSTQLEKNIDGKMKWHFEVRAYEIPEEFKNPDIYTEHVLFSIDKQRSYGCNDHLKAFTPFTSYKGKPWIMVSGNRCDNVSYLEPESEEVGNWNYKSTTFFSAEENSIKRIEIADINQDGYTELFIISRSHIYQYSFSNVTIKVTDPPSTPLKELNISSSPSFSSILYLDSTLPDPPSTPTRSAPSSSSIFYLDSTLLMFIWIFL